MSSILLISTNNFTSGPTDPHFSNVALLFDGQTLTDQSSYAHSMTTNSIDLSTAGGSPYSDGTTAYLSNAHTDTFYSGTLSTTAVGTGAFTIEFWVRLNDIKNWNTMFTSRNASSAQYLENTSTKWWIGSNDATSYGGLYMWSGGSIRVTLGNVLSENTWYYVALSRESDGSLHLYYGTTPGGSFTAKATGTSTVSYTGNNYGIGGPANNAAAASLEWLNGYIRDLRFTVGVARYTGAASAETVPAQSHPTR